MKTQIVFAIFLFALAIFVNGKPHHTPTHNHETKPRILGAIDTCLDKLGLTKAQVREQIKNRSIEKEDCFGACIDKELGVMTADGNIDKVKAAENLPRFVSPENATIIAEACYEKKGENECETSALYRECIREHVPRPPLKPEMQKIHDDCKEVLSMTEEDIEGLEKVRDEADEDCFLACVGEGAGYLNATGHFLVEKALEKVPLWADKEEVEKLLNECASRVGENKCQNAVKSYQCFVEKDLVHGHHYGRRPIHY